MTIQQSIAPDPARRGLITASRMADAMAFSKPKMEWAVLGLTGEILDTFGGGKTGEKKADSAARKIGGGRSIKLIQTEPGGPLQAHRDYMAELVIERLGGTVPGFGSAATAWGQDCEPHARAAFEAETGILATKAAFTISKDIPYIGASPDFLIPDEGGEIKSPYNPLNHMAALLHGMPEEHIPQVQGGMWVTGRKRWRFVSFDPRLPEPFRLFIQTIERDDVYIAKLAEACRTLHEDVERMVAELRQLKAAA